MMRLLRPLRVALSTVIISQTGSQRAVATLSKIAEVALDYR